MKTFLLIITLSISLCVQSQTDKADVLEDLEKGQGMQIQQQDQRTATLKSAARFFGSKDDLTSVISVIPSGSKVTVLDSDSAYFRVLFEDNEGFILKRQAVLDDKPVSASPVTPDQSTKTDMNRGARPVQENQISRFSYLENKYGTSTASKINSGKIWKGMNGEMVRDSWGNPEKINRVISSNTVEESWTYKNTVLYFENNNLVKWGPRN
ncbi:MAG TPA: hypothetical protein VHO46_00415 [Bacteroidales bacterium]|nr:hypothetical protein [Bacteroidales bacterium]